MELGGKYFEKYRISPLGIDISLVESMDSNYILHYSENDRNGIKIFEDLDFKIVSKYNAKNILKNCFIICII